MVRWDDLALHVGVDVKLGSVSTPSSNADIASLEAAVHSIYAFIARTAEPAKAGRCWVTIDYENKPQRDPSVFNGVGGISFFLVDYHRRFHAPAALALAQEAIDWCAAFDGTCYERGLHLGKTGAALAALHLASAREDAALPAFSLANAATILREPPGPVTDLLGGAASNGLYLLKLFARSRDEAHLRGAERCAEWLAAQMTRDEPGTHCCINPSGELGFPPEAYLGAAHGITGIAHFLALLAEATPDDRWAGLARELFATAFRHARPIHDGLNWPVRLGQEELPRCQWSHGAAGIGLTLLTAHRVFGEQSFLDVAVQAAEATYPYGDFRHNYTQGTGLAGGGELLLETYRATGDPRWRERAIEFARLGLAYRESTPEGDAWPTDVPGLYSADFGYGAAGFGHFVLRILADGAIPLPLM